MRKPVPAWKVIEGDRSAAVSELHGSLSRVVREPQEYSIVAPTGFKFLDRMIGGLVPGLHIVSGEPGVGKTTLALHVAAAVARTGLPTLYLTFDSAPQHLVLRLICQQSGLEIRRIMEGQEDPEVVEKAMAECESELGRIAILDSEPLVNLDQISDMARILMSEHDAERCLLIVDYLQVWAAGRREHSEFRHEIGNLITKLRRFAIEFKSPVLVISSQSRDRQGDSSLDSLEGTTDLEYTADTVIFLTRLETPAGKQNYDIKDLTLQANPERWLMLNVRKNRFGEPGSMVVKFLPHVCRLLEGTMRYSP